MWKPDEEMEHYLKEFKPRAISPLEKQASPPRFWLKGLAAAAAIVAAGTSIWMSRRETVIVPQVTSEPQPQESPAFIEKRMNPFLLTKLALEDNRTFNAVLTDESRRVLPSLRGQQSTLRVLAAEEKREP
jgi:hypothetical protein